MMRVSSFQMDKLKRRFVLATFRISDQFTMSRSAIILLAALDASTAFSQPSACGTSQIRLSLTKSVDGSEMGVSWATWANNTPAAYAGVVKYGLSPTSLTMVSRPGDSRNYTLCDLPSPFLHFTVMQNLKAGTTYYYSIVEPRCGSTTPIAFTAPRVVGDKATAYPLRVMAYGDMGISYSQPTASLIADRVTQGDGPDVILHAGDISYADNRGCPRYDSVQGAFGVYLRV